MNATFVWEGDDEEPAAVVRLEGMGTEQEIREALEAEVPRFQDLLALEVGLANTSPPAATWLLISRAHEDRLHQHPEQWTVLLAALAPLSDGCVAVAPEAGQAWTLVTKAGGLVTAVRRADLESLPSGEGPYLAVLSTPLHAQHWREKGLPGKVVPQKAVLVPLRSKLLRQLDQAAGRDFPVVRLAVRRSGSGALWAAAALVAANLALAALPGPAPSPAVAAPSVPPPRPSAVLERLASERWQLKEFRMVGAAWHLDGESAAGLTALEQLRKTAPALKVVQFQALAGRTRLVVEGEGYP